MTSSMNAMKMSRKAPVSSTRPVVLTAKKPQAPSGSHRGSSVMLKFCHAGVASMPSNASELSMRITKITRSQPLVAAEPDHAGKGDDRVSRRRNRDDPGPVGHPAGELQACKREVGDGGRPNAQVGQLPHWAETRDLTESVIERRPGIEQRPEIADEP